MKKKGNFSKRELKKLGMEDLEDSVNMSLSKNSARDRREAESPSSPGVEISPMKTLSLVKLNASV